MDTTRRLLSDRVAIVTGAGRGIGAGIAHALAGAGAKVCANDLNPDRAEHVAAEITATGGEAFGWQADVSNKFQVAAMIENTRERYHRLDILVHNAHISPRGMALTVDEWSWRRTLEVNLTGAFLCTQLAGRVMADEDGGVIVFLTRSPNPGAEKGNMAFLVTQTGLGELARALAVEWAELHVRVEAIPVISPEETTRRVLALCTRG